MADGAQQAGPEDEKDNWSKSLNWLVFSISHDHGLTLRYFFAVANYFLYGESIIYYFKHIVFVDAYFIPFARNHRFISFMLYTVGKSSLLSQIITPNNQASSGS
jgi:phosphatidate cytidylyltransferase